jgi:hypothetical protein
MKLNVLFDSISSRLLGGGEWMSDTQCILQAYTRPLYRSRVIGVVMYVPE